MFEFPACGLLFSQCQLSALVQAPSPFKNTLRGSIFGPQGNPDSRWSSKYEASGPIHSPGPRHGTATLSLGPVPTTLPTSAFTTSLYACVLASTVAQGSFRHQLERSSPHTVELMPHSVSLKLHTLSPTRLSLSSRLGFLRCPSVL